MKLDNYAEDFNDGRWHSLLLTMATDSLTLAVDYRPVKTTKKLRFLTGSTYYIAGMYSIYLQLVSKFKFFVILH